MEGGAWGRVITSIAQRKLRMTQKPISFLRKRDYVHVRDLGHGACGKTVLLYDDILDHHFVCKKYAPQDEGLREELFSSFVREIKLLHLVYHPNIVRVFNYHLYPKDFAGYILMEVVDGKNIDDYLKDAPERVGEIFTQAVDGFCYLEASGVLHRDIRPGNIMVRDDGTLKIIDLGFGKQAIHPQDFDKSITLNWWCDPPDDFDVATYDFRTEVYFVGKLFERIIKDCNIAGFKHKSVLARMCRKSPSDRISSFSQVRQEMGRNQLEGVAFTEEEIAAYRQFSQCVKAHITKIEVVSKYPGDPDAILKVLEDAHRKFMLEDYAPDSAPILRCLVTGTFYYKKVGFPVRPVRDFVELLKACSTEKRRIVISNLHTTLDAIPRYDTKAFDDEIPF